jgi:hypothetical protein
VGLIVVVLVLLPELAHACPACVGQQSSWSTTMKLLGIFILFPFAVGGLVLRAIRNAQRELDERPPRRR